MLLTFLAVLSSTTLLVGAISAIGEQHTAIQGVAVIALALVLAAANFVVVQKAGLSLANHTSVKPEAVQSWYGKAFCLVILLWAIGAGFIGFWIAGLIRSFL
jgi:uncharacterized cupredoxin-like copper-binding protein